MTHKYSILFLFFIGLLFSQNKKTCNTEQKDEDLNTISKCSVKVNAVKATNKQGDKAIRVSVKSVRRRHIRRVATKQKAVALNSLGENSSISNDYKNENITSDVIDVLSRKISINEIASSIPLTAIKEIPLFPKCKNVPKRKYSTCFNNELAEHIQQYFDYPEEAMMNDIQGDVWVRFIIDKKGEVNNIQVRGPKGGESLENQVKYIIAKLPKFTPGKFNGQAVNVKYVLPINFSIQD